MEDINKNFEHVNNQINASVDTKLTDLQKASDNPVLQQRVDQIRLHFQAIEEKHTQELTKNAGKIRALEQEMEGMVEVKVSNSTRGLKQ